jgi:hypothetical protein
MQFDSKAAKQAYKELSTDELVRIAFLENSYVPEAKKLAADELARRNFRVEQGTIERIRAQLEQHRADMLDRELSGFEVEEDMPSWRQRARRRLAPYRNPLSFLVVCIAAGALLNSALDWGLLGLDWRTSRAVGILVMLIWLVFLMPSRAEVEQRMRQAAK